MSQSDFLFVFSLVTFVIGVATFLGGIKAKGSNDGVMMQKLEQALKGIEELKSDVKSMSQTERGLELQVQSHEEQIKTIFSMMKNDDVQTQTLISICEVLKHTIKEEN